MTKFNNKVNREVDRAQARGKLGLYLVVFAVLAIIFGATLSQCSPAGPGDASATSEANK